MFYSTFPISSHFIKFLPFYVGLCVMVMLGRIRKQAISDGFLIMKRIEIKAKKLRINSLAIVNKNKRFLNIIRMNG